jgi:uncharacterized membrane protein HdeD (DUF308 family)
VSVDAASSPPPAGALRELRWIALLHGAITLILGGLLVFLPGRSLTLLAVLTGAALCLTAVFDFVWAARPGHPRAQRAGMALIGALALVAGVIVIARPEGTIRAVALVTGLYLVLMGVVRLVLGFRRRRYGESPLRGALGLAAGLALLLWPDITVGVAAALIGLCLMAQGAVEIVFGIALGREGKQSSQTSNDPTAVTPPQDSPPIRSGA